jgi:hypothetical protein
LREEKNILPLQGMEPRVVRPVVSHYTDYSVPLLNNCLYSTFGTVIPKYLYVLVPIVQKDTTMKEVGMSLFKSITDFRIFSKWQVEFGLCVTQKRMCVLPFVTFEFGFYVRII